MSAETIRGVEVREWQGSTFDPDEHRFFSILPAEDGDEGYCVRHDREMDALDPVVHHEGGLYTTADGWHVYSCPACRQEVGPTAPKVFREFLMWSFSVWDNPEEDALSGAFQYVCEGTPEDVRELLVGEERDVSKRCVVVLNER